MTRNEVMNGLHGQLKNGLTHAGEQAAESKLLQEDDYFSRPRTQAAIKQAQLIDAANTHSPTSSDNDGPPTYLNGVGEDSPPKRPRPVQRTRSDAGPQSRVGARISSPKEEKKDDPASYIRHGWDDEHNSAEYLSALQSNFFMYYTDKRHDSNGAEPQQFSHFPSKDWRMKDRMKTISAALTVCLNIGVDPPDVIKTNPTAKLEAWTDPTASLGGTKVMEQIGRKLQEQYESLSLRTRYKQYLDPSIEETKRFTQSLRKNAKDERVLFHYNGHGVPLPTPSGELWVFNKNYTQYIPVSIYELQSWLGAPSLFVYDCSYAGNILHNFDAAVAKHEKDNEEQRQKDPSVPRQSYGDCIQLAACDRNDMLPTNPDLPADLFTCCLTTPIDIALRWFVLQNPLECPANVDDARIPVPGRLADRRSPLGELNWIFTAITDTIAWNLLPNHLFKKLFRQDLMVAALFRNFLLAERIMRANHCKPLSAPKLPETHHHPLWQSWDLALEQVIRQLPALISAEKNKTQYEYMHSEFFSQQLTAFEVYLSSGPTEDHAPDQLPIVLQVLLSQVHRLRALILLSRFLDLGPWAVHLALSIGIFPYVVKLLQAQSVELKPVMVFIWARIMAVDYTVQQDLMKDSGVQYFIGIMDPSSELPVQNASEHRAMCAFITATFCRKYPNGQTVCLGSNLIQHCLTNMNEPENPLLRQWSCLCISALWKDHNEAKWAGLRIGAHTKLCELSLDPVPEVRASMLHALTTLWGIPGITEQLEQLEEMIAQQILFMTNDGSPLVRKELCVFWSHFVERYQSKFIVAAYEQLLEERDRQGGTIPMDGFPVCRAGEVQSYSANTVYGSIWAQVLILSVDSLPEVAFLGSAIVDHIHEQLMESPMSSLATAVIEDITRLSSTRKSVKSIKKTPSVESMKSTGASRPTTPPITPLQRQESYLSLSIKRTASSLRSFVVGPYYEQAWREQEENERKASQTNGRVTPGGCRGNVSSDWQAQTHHKPSVEHPHPPHAYPIPPTVSFDSCQHHDPPSIPLSSTLVSWSTTYFLEPQMRPIDPDSPGSSDYNTRLYRRTRNERIISGNQPLKSVAGSSKWTRLQQYINNTTQPTHMVFHQFDPHLVIADDKAGMTVWDFESNVMLSQFSNDNPTGSRINAAKFLNEDDQPLLLVGSSDGVLKVYRNYSDPNAIRLVTAYRAVTELIPSNKNAGLVFDWSQSTGKILVAGDSKVIKIWNAATEMCISNIPARSSSCVTSLTSDQLAGQIFVAGFGDGVVRVYDQRIKPRDAMVHAWREHQQWVVDVHMQRGGIRELVSASRDGDVKIWDIRYKKAVLTIKTVESSGSGFTYGHRATRSVTTPINERSYNNNSQVKLPVLRSLSLHEHAPVLAVGTDRHEVRSFNTNGDPLGVFEPLGSGVWGATGTAQGRGGATAAAAGYAAGVGSVVANGLGMKRNAICATAYHPHRMVLATAGIGGTGVSLVTY